MKSDKLYALLKDITKIKVIETQPIKMLYLKGESKRVEYRFFGLIKTVIPAKPDRFLPMHGESEDYAIRRYDNENYWRTFEDFKLKEYRLDEITKSVYKKAYVSVELKNQCWEILEYFDSTDEAKEFAQKILDLRPGEFV
jgi:hypothetical protein